MSTETNLACEAKIDRYPDHTLEAEGLATRTSCQRCEISVIFITKNNFLMDIKKSDNSVNLITQNCPKLIEKGFLRNQIPVELLPDCDSL